MWLTRVPLDNAERSATLYAPFVNFGLMCCWMFGALLPIALFALVSLLHRPPATIVTL